MRNVSPYVRAAGIGAVAGLRSFTAPAATLATGGSAWTGLVTALAAGECVADKLPFAPSRLQPPALLWRLVSGGSCGSALAGRADGSRMIGACAGALGALAAAYGGYGLRRYLTKGVGLPDAPVALFEDAIAVFGARVATST